MHNLEGTQLLLVTVRIDVVQVSARPVTVPEGDQGPELVDAVDVGKGNLNKEERNVSGAAAEMRENLDSLCHQDLDDEEDNEDQLRVKLGRLNRVDERDEERHVPQEGEIGDASPVDHESGPGIPVEERGISEHDGVGPEGGSGPAEKLPVELGPLSEGCLDSRILGVLEPDQKSLLHGVAGEEIVIVGKNLDQVKEEPLVAEFLHEVRVGQKLSLVHGRATGDDKDAAVNGIGGTELLIVSLQVVDGNEIYKGRPGEAAGLRASDAFLGGNHAHVRILKGSEDGRDEVGALEEAVVIHENRDGSVNMRHRLSDLVALARLGNGSDGEESVTGGSAQGLEDSLAFGLELGAHGDQDDLGRSVGQDAVNALVKVRSVGVNGGHDDGAVVPVERRLCGNRRGTVDAVSNDMTEEASVPKREDGQEDCEPEINIGKQEPDAGEGATK